jgi:hypothetical protein
MSQAQLAPRDFSRRIYDLFTNSMKWWGMVESTPAPHEYHVRMASHAAVGLVQMTQAAPLQDKVKLQTTRQLGLSLRLQLSDAQERVMLESLTHLVEVNELSFAELVQKLDHLYPEAMRRLDRHLKARITSLIDA